LTGKVPVSADPNGTLNGSLTDSLPVTYGGGGGRNDPPQTG